MDNLEAGEALNEIMLVLKVVSLIPYLLCLPVDLIFSKQANKSLTTLAPWSSACPVSLVHETRQVAFEMLKVVSKFIGPFMPGVGRKLEEALGKDGDVQSVRLF